MLVGTWGYWCVVVTIAAIDAPAAYRGPDALRAALSASYDNIRGLDMSYEMRNLAPFLAEDADSTGHEDDLYLRRRVVVKVPTQLYIETSHGSRHVHWSQDRYRTIEILSDKEFCRVEPSHRVWERSRVETLQDLPREVRHEFLFVAMGWWPLGHIAAPRLDGVAYMVTDLRRDKSYSVVRPVQELIEGQWCHVLEKPGVDTLWISVQDTAVLMKRATYNGSTGTLMQVIRLYDHKHIGRGVRIPGRIRNVQFDYGADSVEHRRRKVVHSEWKLIDASATLPDDQLFHPSPLTGSLSISRDGSFKQISAGGQDEVMRDMVKMVKNIRPRVGKESQQWSRAVDLILCSGGVIIAIIISGWMRRTNKRVLNGSAVM